MRWRRLGHIFASEGQHEWMHTHAMIPVAEQLDGDLFRIFFSPRDRLNRGHGAYLTVDMRRPDKVVYLHPTPVLEPGELGAFDDSGALPNSIVRVGSRRLLYYTGINVGVTVPIRNSIGLAEWSEDEHRFVRRFRGPVIDRTRSQPHFVATPEVHLENGLYRAWFTSCVRWAIEDGRPKHYYNLEYAESDDGIDWRRNQTVAVDFLDRHEYALGVPRVVKDGSIYRMWFCSRAAEKEPTYRIRYAESSDGIAWERRPDGPGLDVSDAAWENQMVCYPFVFDHGGQRYLLYNGNGYGKTGFGLAVLDA